MSYAIRRLLNHLPIQIGARSDRVLRTAQLKHAQFACFLEDTGFRARTVDYHDRRIRRRRFAKSVFMWAIAFGVAWVALESARAVTLF